MSSVSGKSEPLSEPLRILEVLRVSPSLPSSQVLLLNDVSETVLHFIRKTAKHVQKKSAAKLHISITQFQQFVVELNQFPPLPTVTGSF